MNSERQVAAGAFLDHRMKNESTYLLKIEVKMLMEISLKNDVAFIFMMGSGKGVIHMIICGKTRSNISSQREPDSDMLFKSQLGPGLS